MFDLGMRWDGQDVEYEDEAALPTLGRMSGLLRTVTSREFPGVRFHEVAARSVLNRVPDASKVPFRWTINTYRGCAHACVYCFARGTHAWLELDTGRDFDSEIVVKVNAVEVLTRELARPSWKGERVALGTNTDPYQRAEGRYRLMPGVIRALASSGTPLSILTKGSIVRKDLPLLSAVSQDVEVGMGVSLAVWDHALHATLEPGTPSPEARLATVRAIREAGLPCTVMLAPVLPWLTDGEEDLDAAIAKVANAGATAVTVLPLHLRPGAREWFMAWLERERPSLVAPYERLYGRRSYVPATYNNWLRERVQRLLRRHGLDRTTTANVRAAASDSGARPVGTDRQPMPDVGQLSLL
jgi:DNA repair photolyase